MLKQPLSFSLSPSLSLAITSPSLAQFPASAYVVTQIFGRCFRYLCVRSVQLLYTEVWQPMQQHMQMFLGTLQGTHSIDLIRARCIVCQADCQQTAHTIRQRLTVSSQFAWRCLRIINRSLAIDDFTEKRGRPLSCLSVFLGWSANICLPIIVTQQFVSQLMRCESVKVEIQLQVIILSLISSWEYKQCLLSIWATTSMWYAHKRNWRNRSNHLRCNLFGSRSDIGNSHWKSHAEAWRFLWSFHGISMVSKIWSDLNRHFDQVNSIFDSVMLLGAE